MEGSSFLVVVNQNSPTSPAMPTIFGGWGRNGRDLDFSAIMTTVLEFLVDVWTPTKALAVSIAAKLATIWNIMLVCKRF